MKWTDIKRELRKKNCDELIQALKQLVDLNPENKSFIESYLFPFSGHSLNYYKKEISNSVNPGMNAELDIKRGRNAIQSFKKASPDDLAGRMDLMLHFVEQGAYFTLEYGDIDGPFYDSLCRMIDSILDLASSLSELEYAHLAKRMQDLNSHTENQIGWGFSDCITEANSEIQDRISK